MGDGDIVQRADHLVVPQRLQALHLLAPLSGSDEGDAALIGPFGAFLRASSSALMILPTTACLGRFASALSPVLSDRRMWIWPVYVRGTRTRA